MRVHKILFAFSFVFSAHSIYAQQFTPNGSSLYYNGGNVGIGNANPNTLLEIKKDVGGALGPVLRLTGGGSAGAQCAIDLATYDPGTNLPGGRIVATDDGAFGSYLDFQNKLSGAMGNSMATRLRITNTGNVGIGTTSPACKLHVSGWGHVAASIDDALSGFTQLWSDNAIIWKNGNSNGALRFGSATDLSAGNWSEKMRITDAGNVAIGTATPRGKLDVWSGSIYVTGTDINGTFVAGSQSGIAYMGCNNLTNGIAIMNNGNVAIGTNDTKGYRFAVNGDAVFTKIIVKTSTSWPDYVFNTGYKLPSLKELEQYIQQQHHLPEVPSAEEVQQKGLDVGENQAALLKKIEELTLYIIEQNKRIEKLETKLDSLEKQNK